MCLWAAQGLDNNNGGFNWGSRRYNVSDLMSPTAEAPVCLRYKGIDDNNGSVGKVRQSSRLSDDDGGVGRGQGIRYASEVLETMTEAAGAR